MFQQPVVFAGSESEGPAPCAWLQPGMSFRGSQRCVPLTPFFFSSREGVLDLLSLETRQAVCTARPGDASVLASQG